MTDVSKQMSRLVSNSAISSLLSLQDNVVRFAVLLLGYFFGPYFGVLPTNQNILQLGAAAMFMPTVLRAVGGTARMAWQGAKRTEKWVEDTFSTGQLWGVGGAIAAGCALFLLHTRANVLPAVVSEGIQKLLESGSAASRTVYDHAQAGLSYCFGLLGISGDVTWIKPALKEWLDSYGYSKVFETPLTLWQGLADSFGVVVKGALAGAAGFGASGARAVRSGTGVLKPAGRTVVAATFGLAAGAATAGVSVAPVLQDLLFKVSNDAEPHFIMVTIANILKTGQQQNIAQAFAARKAQMIDAIRRLGNSIPGSAAAQLAYDQIVAATNVQAVMADETIPQVVKLFAMIKVWMADAAQFVLGKIQTYYPAANWPAICTGFAFMVAAIGAVMWMRAQYSTSGGTNVSETDMEDLARLVDVSKDIGERLIAEVGQDPANRQLAGLFGIKLIASGVANESGRSKETIQVMKAWENLGDLAHNVELGTVSPQKFLNEFGMVLSSADIVARRRAANLKDGATEHDQAKITAIMEAHDFWFKEAELLVQALKRGEKVAQDRKPLFDRTAAILAQGTLKSGGKVGGKKIVAAKVAKPRTLRPVATRKSTRKSARKQ